MNHTDFDFDSAGTMVPGVFDATLIDKFKPKNYKYPLDWSLADLSVKWTFN